MMNQNYQSKLMKAPKTWLMMKMMCPWHVKKMKKAEKKRRKKAEKSIPEDAMDDDYDFKLDYFKKGSAMDVGDKDNENQMIGKVPMSGIEFPDE